MDRDLLGLDGQSTANRATANAAKLRSLRALGTVLGTGLLTILDALGVKRAANDVVTHTRQVLHTTATNKDDRVFLQVVAFTTDIRNDFKAIRETHLGNLTESRVRLLRGRRVNTSTNATLLRAVLQGRALAFIVRKRTGLTNELVNSWHKRPSNKN